MDIAFHSRENDFPLLLALPDSRSGSRISKPFFIVSALAYKLREKILSAVIQFPHMKNCGNHYIFKNFCQVYAPP
jgi:hypothetical protein